MVSKLIPERKDPSSERSVHQDGPDGKRGVTSQEIFESDKLKDETFEKLKDDNHDNHKKQPNKTLLRSRSCSFILSLSYQLKDAVRVYGLEVKSKDDIGEIATPSHTSESASCLGERKPLKWNARLHRGRHREC